MRYWKSFIVIPSFSTLGIFYFKYLFCFINKTSYTCKMKFEFNTKKFSEYIAQKRYSDRLGVREAAKKSYTSAATLSRCENGKMPDVGTFINISKWIGVPLATFIKKSRKIKV